MRTFDLNMESKILEGLSPAQRAAVENYSSHSLIVAGAGSGKTRVLTSRIAYMIEQGVNPGRILALTFTNRAANEMRERIEKMVGRASRYIFMGTFHSVFSRILRNEAEVLGYPQAYTIYEPNDCRNLVKTIVRDLHLNDDIYKPQVICSRISLAKNKLITPAAYLANPILAAEDSERKMPQFGQIYQLYCQRCKQNGAMDFDDLLLQTNILFRDHRDVLKRYQEHFEYILVDEYQDTNYAQYIIIRRLAEGGAKVCVVGDDAQSIYSFRGANVENILNFKRDFPNAEIFKLERNYRSTQTIVNAANSVIAHNSHRLDKECFSAGDYGDRIRVIKAYTDREEAELTVEDLRRTVLENGGQWSDAALLYRTNAQSQILEESMRRHGVPYRIYKGHSFYDHAEIKDLIAYIRLIINPLDDEALKRAINTPSRGIGDTTVAKIAALAAQNNQSMWEAIDTLLQQPAIDPAYRQVAKRCSDFVSLIRELNAAKTQSDDIYELGLQIATRSGLIGMYRCSSAPEALSALDNIEELLNSMQRFKEERAEEQGDDSDDTTPPTLEEWLQNVMLLTDMDQDNRNDKEDRNRVTMMTVHSAKGLEFKYVYIAGLEDGLFPSQRACDTLSGLEEERRLFYVALTRAKVRAVLSFADTRFRWGSMDLCRPSRFLSEIDEKYLDAPADALGDRTERQTAFDEPRHDSKQTVENLRRQFDYRFRQSNVERPKPQPAHVPTPAPAPEPARRPNLRRINTPGGSTSAAGEASAGNTYTRGMRVEHRMFGRGTIVDLEQMTNDTKLVVRFDSENVGEKKLLAKFASLKIL